jgi:hypothetical protein
VVEARCWRRRRRSESYLTILKNVGRGHQPEGLSFKGRLRANNRRGGGGEKTRNTRAWKCRSISITRNQSSAVWEVRNGNFIVTVAEAEIICWGILVERH